MKLAGIGVGSLVVVGVVLLVVYLLGGFRRAAREAEDVISGGVGPGTQCGGTSQCTYFPAVRVMNRETGTAAFKAMHCVELPEDLETSSSESVVCKACDGTYIFAADMPYGDNAVVFPVRPSERLRAISAYNDRC